MTKVAIVRLEGGTFHEQWKNLLEIMGNSFSLCSADTLIASLPVN